MSRPRECGRHAQRHGRGNHCLARDTDRAYTLLSTSVVFSIAANAGAARTGIIIIEGNTVTVNQAATGSVRPPN